MRTPQEPPERRYTYGGRVAHLLPYAVDYSKYPYHEAFCGHSPQWSTAWLGSGSQAEEDLAASLPLCKRCAPVSSVGTQ